MTPGELIFPGRSFFYKVGSSSSFPFPLRHFREGGNPEIQSTKHGPPLFSEGDEGGGR